MGRQQLIDRLHDIERRAGELAAFARSLLTHPRNKDAASALLRHARGTECAAAVWRQRIEKDA